MPRDADPESYYKHPLEPLDYYSKVLVTQQRSTLGILTCFEAANKYTIKDIWNRELYEAIEDGGCCIRNFVRCARRPFSIVLNDPNNESCIRIHRPLRCDNICCCTGCEQIIHVEADREEIGFIRQKLGYCQPQFVVYARDGIANEMKPVLELHGPYLPFRSCGIVDFKVMTLEQPHLGIDSKHEIGEIVKGYATDPTRLSEADTYAVEFPKDLKSECKALILAFCLYMDMMYMEG